VLVSEFPNLRDEAVYTPAPATGASAEAAGGGGGGGGGGGARHVFLYKRAQIMVADMWAAYGQLTCAPGASRAAGGAPVSPAAFHDMHALTCFPDYRIPQLLLARGVFRYAPDLLSAVSSRRPLPAGSREEVEIRAATVVAVQRLRAAMASRLTDVGGGGVAARPITSVEVDWLLWQVGEAAKDDIAPHHRVDTIFY